MIYYIISFKKTIVIQILFLIYNSKIILGIQMKKTISKFYNYLANRVSRGHSLVPLPPVNIITFI